MRSANEIAGLVLKAARGAGLPLGIAEDLARAAPFLAQAGELDTLRRCFETPPEGEHPALAITGWLDLQAAGMPPNAPIEQSALAQALTAARKSAAPKGPFAVEATLWQFLFTQAEKTFVPETEASRAAGAGAGLSDND